MDTLQQTLNRAIASLPTLTLEKLIARKLREQGVKYPRTLPRKIADHILSGTAEPFRSAARTVPKDISLSFGKSDVDELTRIIDSFSKVQLPALVPALAEQLATKTLKGLKQSWTEELRLQRADVSGFRRRMEKTWGEPLGKLRMLLTIAREWCGEAHGKSHEAGALDAPRLKKLMVRFLVRSCQITDEIVCLLENGFADGAMARWRTLHEIGVVAAVIRRWHCRIIHCTSGSRVKARFEQVYELL